MMERPRSVVVPKPVPDMVSAAVAVSVSESEVVPILKTPPVDCVNQCLRLLPALVSVSVSLAAAPAMLRREFGVVVPMPSLPASLKKMEVVAESDVPGAEKYGMEPVADAEPMEPCETPEV